MYIVKKKSVYFFYRDMYASNRYNKVHVVVLQYMMRHRVIPFKSLNDMLESAFPDTSLDIEQVILVVNENLCNFNMRILTRQCEITEEKLCILTNMRGMKDTKKYNIMSEVEVEYFFKILDLIVTSESGAAGSVDILNLSNDLKTKSITKTLAEQYVSAFVEKKLLVTNSKGIYYLSALSIEELEKFINCNYSDFKKTCKLCNRLVFFFKSCEKCESAFHRYCLSTFNLSNNENKCPNCNESWCRPE